MENSLDKSLRSLRTIFREARDKHEANVKSAEVLAEMSADPSVFTEVLRRHIEKPGTLNTRHYPVVGLDIELNEYFGIVANCWIPLPDRATDISTKAIHHHGDMLLSTVTAFGTGYEHWMFETPAVVDAEKEIYELKLLERAPHPLHHVAFVDAYVAHLPMYPPDLTITYALWSSRFPTTWKDRVKRMPLLQKNSKRLRDVATKFGMAGQLELKVVEYFDFYPTCDGFRGIRNREEFERSNNEDYLASLFHVIQQSGNESLTSELKAKLNTDDKIDNPEIVHGFLNDLQQGVTIEGRLSLNHYGIARANFSSGEILDAFEAQRSVTHAGNLEGTVGS